MASTQPKEQRMALIKENLAEVLNFDIVEKIMDEGVRNPKIYWGTATTSAPHCGYFVPAIKIAQLLAADCDVTILLADIHAFLDNLKAPIEMVDERARFYRYIITAILEAVGVKTDKLRFVLGSSYQKTSEYVMDVYRMCSVVSENDARRAGSETVKQSANPPLSGLLYPVLQILDEQYLDVDCQFGGMDQRKLFIAAKDWLPKLGYKERAHIMNPLVPGLQGPKMSSSDPNSKIDLLDTPEAITKKIKKAECFPKIVEGNGVLAFTEYVLLPAAALKGKKEFIVERREGEPLVYNNIEKMHEDYKNDVLTPQDLKPAVAKALVALTAPILAAYKASAEWQATSEKAYPTMSAEDALAKKKKEDKKREREEKKLKNKGKDFPVRNKDGAEAPKQQDKPEPSS